MSALATCYVSSGCNRSAFSVDWGQNGLICFCSCQSVLVYQPKGRSHNGRVTHTFHGHKSRVNCVTWIRDITGNGNEERIVSGSSDGKVCIWKYSKNKTGLECVLDGHKSAVNAVTAVSTNVGGQFSTYIVTASADSTAIIWKQSSETGRDFEQLQTIKFGSGFCLDCAITLVPKCDALMLAFGCDDQRIHLFIKEENQFQKVISLQGHEDWIRALSFANDDNGDILLASASQDFFIRIWRLSEFNEENVQKAVKDMSLNEEIKMKENTFSFQSPKGVRMMYAVKLESVLSGHENWIYSVRWQPPIHTEKGNHQPMALLSASMDKTMILWKPDKESGLWIDEVRVGEVGGNTLGFYGGLFSPDGQSIMAHGYQGAFHQWTYNEEKNTWNPTVTVSGHFDAVQDLDWDPKGGCFLVSVSSDQTTRLHAPWKCQNQEPLWHEIARPQVHGYDLQCLAMINRYKMASGADEKVVRAFEAPKNFVQNFCEICGLDYKTELSTEEAQNRPEGASVPALGLSNKAVFEQEGRAAVDTDSSVIQPHPNDQYPEVYFHALSLTEPPTEENLLQNTLWPEVQKLYGHGNEIFALASNPQGTLLASACKASKAEFAYLILWDTITWKQLQCLSGHTLTVTCITFSHSGSFLLSVSRDRTWMLYSRQEDSEKLFSLKAGTNKNNAVHSRIIWGCCWSHDDQYFVTASRDKKIIIWSLEKACQSILEPEDSHDINDAATAVAMAPILIANNTYLVAIGTDSGRILLYTWNSDKSCKNRWTAINVPNDIIFHSLTVKKIKFRPCLGKAGISSQTMANILQLASCSADHSVRIYDIDLIKVREQALPVRFTNQGLPFA